MRCALSEYTVAARLHAFARQACELLARRGRPGRKRDAPARAGDAVPGKARTLVYAQHLADQSRTPRQPGAARDFSITGKTAALDAAHSLTDGGSALPRRHVHRTQIDPRRRTQLRYSPGNDYSFVPHGPS